MKFLDRIAAVAGGRRGRKGWSEPPFWANDSLRLPLLSTSPLTPDRERVENSFEGYVQGAYKADGIVFACILARQQVFSQARFRWRRFDQGKPGDLFGSTDLGLLERPWPSGTTGELLARMESTASLAGNYYATTVDDANRVGAAATGPGRRVVHMRPDWVTIVVASPSDDPNDLRAKIAGFLYEPPGGRSKPVLLLPNEVCHYSPIPDPEARYRGMSWLTPILREIQADKAATEHKSKFFDNGATLNTVVRLDKDVTTEQFREFVQLFKETHEGADNAYRTLFLGGGADVTVVGTDLKQLDFKATQGAGETRVAAAAGIHPTIVGLSEGLQGSSLNAGNFGAARRLVADKTLRHLWSVAAASLQTLVSPPDDRAELWYDTGDIAFLREDERDAAAITKEQMLAIESGVRAGYEPDTVVKAVITGNLNLLVHTGLYSVQLIPPNQAQQQPALSAAGDDNAAA